MDVDTLKYSYLEQALIQISRLREEQEESSSSLGKHRLFRQNPFEDMGTTERQHLENLLVQSLILIGSKIDNKKVVHVIDRRRPANYDYETNGIIKLKPKGSIRYSACSEKKCLLMLHVIAKIIDLIQNDRYITNRELFYLSVEMCRSSITRLNAVLEDLCCLLGCSRVHIRVLPQSKGLIFGSLKLKLKCGEVLDCSKTIEGTKLPTPKVPIIDIKSDANFVLIVEKDSVFQKILRQEKTSGFLRKYQAILFTARGNPDVNSRAFLNLLEKALKIPFFALTDADPHGCEIACCYKFGSYSSAHEAAYLTLPRMKWLGLLTSDVTKHQIPDSSMISLSENDYRKIESLIKRPYLQERPDWINQLNLMRDVGKKAELESIDISGDYLTRTYLPNKLRYASWL